MESRNPYIESFCRALIEKHEEKLPDEAKDKLAEDLYRLFENMLGRNMVNALPEEVKNEFVSKYDKGSRNIDFEHIREIFERFEIDQQEIMKKTMKEFAALYFKNR